MSVFLAQTAQTTTTSPDGSWLAIGLGLAALAIVFFALELFVPSGGVLATLCGASVFGSIASLFAYDTSAGGFALVAYLVAAPFAVVYGIKLWAKTPIGRNLILGSTELAQTKGMDEDAAALEAATLRRERVEELRAMIGKRGTVLTTLRPVGIVLIDGTRIDALAQSGVIEEGAEIEVVDAYDNQLKVRPTAP
jgi:membrane-bound serine protease (ClpP class)